MTGPAWKTIEETLRAHGVDPRRRSRDRNRRTYPWYPLDDPRRGVQVSVTRRPVYSVLDVDWFGWADESPAWFQFWVQATVWPFVHRARERHGGGAMLPGGRTCVVADVLTAELPELLGVLLPKVADMAGELVPFDGRRVS